MDKEMLLARNLCQLRHLATNGLLTIETYSKSSAKAEALRGHVAIVVYDANGNAIWLSEDHKCTTRCGTWDPSCASSGTNSWFEQFPEKVGQLAASLDIVHDDEGLGNMVANTRKAIKESTGRLQVKSRHLLLKFGDNY